MAYYVDRMAEFRFIIVEDSLQSIAEDRSTEGRCLPPLPRDLDGEAGGNKKKKKKKKITSIIKISLRLDEKAGI